MKVSASTYLGSHNSPSISDPAHFRTANKDSRLRHPMGISFAFRNSHVEEVATFQLLDEHIFWIDGDVA